MPAPRSTSPDYRQHLVVETPEHVFLDLEIAGIGSRAFAAVLDMMILVGATVAVGAALAILGGYGLDHGSCRRRDSHDFRLRGVDRIFHRLRRAAGRADARQANRRHSRGRGHWSCRHARGRGGQEPAPRRRLPPSTLPAGRPPRGIPAKGQAPRRHGGRHRRRARPAHEADRHDSRPDPSSPNRRRSSDPDFQSLSQFADRQATLAPSRGPADGDTGEASRLPRTGRNRRPRPSPRPDAC